MKKWNLKNNRRDLFKFACMVKNAVSLKFDLYPTKFALFHMENPDRKKYWGTCSQGGVIRVDVYSDKENRFATQNEIIDTVIHEMAHLRYRRHSKKFYNFFNKMYGWFCKSFS